MNTTKPTEVAPVYDVQRVEALLNFNYPSDRLASFGKAPDARPGFITFFDPGWSILKLRKVSGKGIFYPRTWYDDEPFAKFQDQPRFRQLRMEPVKDSFGKKFIDQQALVPPDEEIPTSRVVVMAIAIHFLATGEHLFSDCWVRCSDQALARLRVQVGAFESEGFLVNRFSDENCFGRLGLASSQKF